MSKRGCAELDDDRYCLLCSDYSPWTPECPLPSQRIPQQWKVVETDLYGLVFLAQPLLNPVDLDVLIVPEMKQVSSS